MKGKIHSIETCGTVDGPGIRYILFTQGCPLRCKYCHNPDTWNMQNGKDADTEDLIKEIVKYKTFMQFSGGGVTISGGEPLLQPEFVKDLFQKCKANNIHTAIDTSGFISIENSDPVLDYTDLVLLDINLPDISGIEFCSRAKSRFPELKILAVTSMAQRHVVEKSIQAGVDGFVLKTSDIKDITTGIKELIAGKKYFGSGVSELISNRPSGGPADPIITRRESEILRHIADGFTNQEIAEKLFISISTVDSHRKNLLIKFDAKNTAALVKIAVEKGLI